MGSSRKPDTIQYGDIDLGRIPVSSFAPKRIKRPLTHPPQCSSKLSLNTNDYVDLLDFSSSRIACFSFEDGLDIDLHSDEIVRDFWSSEAYCVYANISFLQTFGKGARQDALGMPLRYFFPYGDEKNRQCVEAFAYNNCSLQNYEYPYISEDGSAALLLVSLYPIIESRTIQKIWILHRNLIDSTAAVEKLRAAEEHYRTLVERPGLILARIRPNGFYQYISPLVVETIGTTPEDIYAHPKRWSEAIHPDDLEAYQAFFLAREMKSIKPIELEYRIKYTDGSYRWVLERQTPRLNDHGELSFFDCVVMSIQEKKNLENELIQAERTKTMGRLAAGIAHEFNNHLTAIIGQLGIGLEELSQSSPTYRHIASAEQSALVCAEIARQLISFGSGSNADLNPLCLNKLVEDTVEFLSHLLPQTTSLKVDIEPHLPSIRGNSAYLQQLIILLAKRASQSMNGEGEIKLTVQTKELQQTRPGYLYPEMPTGKYIEILFVDSGISIPEEDLEHIFDPPYKLHSSQTKVSENLSTAYSVVETHGGAIYVRSKPRLGTTIGILLPFIDLPKSTKTTSPILVKDIQSCIKEDLKDSCVLVAEDDEMVLAMVQTALTMNGISVLAAVDGEQAIELFRKHKDSIGLALIDHTMPKLSGREVLHTVRNEAPELPVILTSGYGDSLPLRQELEGDPCTCFLSKPFPIPELLQTIEGNMAKANTD